MTTVQIKLPDELAQNAQQAGQLTSEAIEGMLSEQLKKQAGASLRDTWARAPDDALTPEIEQMIDQEIQALRAMRHPRNAS